MDSSYDLRSVKLPRLAGLSLKIFAELVETPGIRGLVTPSLLKTGGMDTLRALQIDENPTYYPFMSAVECDPVYSPPELTLSEASKPDEGFNFDSIDDYARAYLSGALTPEDVAEHVIQIIQASDRLQPPMRAFIASDAENIRVQARASAERFRQGKPFGLLDGVPIAVKDEIDMLTYGTTVGTKFLGKTPVLQDATVSARLRAAGALLIGKANMHEIGVSPTGHNPHHGTARNPYNPLHFTGGSSSGPACAVAMGICPGAIGADGGGSIRTPASFCGLVGLKATLGRVSEFGAAPLTWTMGHIGPLADNARDAAILYAVIAGPDPADPNSLHQPPVQIPDFENTDLHGLTLGIFRPWFEHADPAVVSTCSALVERFCDLGAQVREITIPAMDAARLAHSLTILVEMAHNMDRYDREHRRDFALETRLSMALGRAFTARDYVQAQRIRTQAMRHYREALEQVDMIVTPATAMTAPAIPADALPDGVSDLSLVTDLLRYAYPGNLTGLPAISFPAGYDPHGMPVGFQAMGRPWEEHRLLHLANAADGLVPRRAPQVYYKMNEN